MGRLPNAPGPAAPRWRYDVFLSYAHADGSHVARALKHGLERIARPWYRLRDLRVFLDRTNLDAAPKGWERLRSALAQSGAVVVVASPAAAASDWVGRELGEWLRLGRADQTLLALAAGSLRWRRAASGAHGWDPQGTTALPPALLHAFGDDGPFWVDLRQASTPEALSLRNPAFKEAVAKLVATVRRTTPEALLSEDVRLHRRAVRLAWTVALTVLALLVAVGWLYVRQTRERERAHAAEAREGLLAREKRLEEARTLLSESERLAAGASPGAALHRVGQAHALAPDLAPLPLLVRRWLATGPPAWTRTPPFPSLVPPEGPAPPPERRFELSRALHWVLVPRPTGFRAYDASTGAPVTAWEAGDRPLRGFALSPDGQRLLTHVEPEGLALREVSDPTRVVARFPGAARALALAAADGPAAWVQGRTLTLAHAGLRLRTLDVGDELEDELAGLSVDPSGAVLALTPEGRGLRWDGRSATAEPVAAPAPTPAPAPAAPPSAEGPDPGAADPEEQPDEPKGLWALYPHGPRAAFASRTGALWVLDPGATAWRALPPAAGGPAPRAAAVSALSFSADGQRLLVGSVDGEVATVDLAGGARVRVRAADPDDGWTGLAPRVPVSLTDTGTGELLVGHLEPAWIEWRPLEPAQAGGGARPAWSAPGGCSAFDATLGLVAVGGLDGSVRLLDPHDGAERGWVKAHASEVLALGFAAEPARLVTVGREGAVTTWSVPALERLGTRDVGGRALRCAALSPDGGHVVLGLAAPPSEGPVAGLRPQTLLLGSTRTLAPWTEAPGTLLPPDAVAVVAGGLGVFAASPVGEVVGWEAAGSRRFGRSLAWPPASGGGLPALRARVRLALAPSGRVLYVGTPGGLVQALRADDLFPEREMRLGPGPVAALAVTADAGRLVIGLGPTEAGASSPTPRLHVVDARDLLPVARLAGPRAGVRHLALAPDGVEALVGGEAFELAVLPLSEEGRRPVPFVRPADALQSELRCVSAGGALLVEETLARPSGAAPGSDPPRRLVLVEPARGRRVPLELEPAEALVPPFALDAAGERLSAGRGRRRRVWDLRTGALVADAGGGPEVGGGRGRLRVSAAGAVQVLSADGELRVGVPAPVPAFDVEPAQDVERLAVALHPFGWPPRVELIELGSASRVAEALAAAGVEERVAWCAAPADDPVERAAQGPAPEDSALGALVQRLLAEDRASALKARRAALAREALPPGGRAAAAAGTASAEARAEASAEAAAEAALLQERLVKGEGVAEDRLRWAARLVELEPQRLVAWTWLANACVARALELAARGAEGAAEAERLVARARAAYGQVDVLEGAPAQERAGALRGWADLLLRQGQVVEGRERLRLAFGLGVERLGPDVWQALAQLEAQLGDHGRAAEVAEAAVRAYPDAPEAQALRAQARTSRLAESARATALRLPALMIAAVAPGGVAAGLGLQPGDVVLAVEGVECENAAEGWRRLAALGQPAAPGRTEPRLLVVGRGAERVELRLTGVLSGLEPYGLVGEGAPRPLVTGVQPGSAAERGQVRPGDYVWAVDGREVASPYELAERLRAGSSAPLVVRFRRPLLDPLWGLRLRRGPGGDLERDAAGRVAWAFEERELRLAAGEPLGVDAQQDVWADPVWR